MGTSIVMRVAYNRSDPDKSCVLIERNHDLGGTDYSTIAYIDDRHARLFQKEGIRWLYGEPDWSEYYVEIDKLKLEIDIKMKQKKLEEWNARSSNE